jgi:transmembrane sensor
MTDKERLDLPRLRLGWDEGRTERLLASVHTRIARRKRAMQVAITTTAVAASLVAVVALRHQRVATPASVANTISTQDGPAPREMSPRGVSRSAIKLADGSTIDLDPAVSEVRVVEESEARVRVELVRGTSRYDVAHKPDRAFEVRAGAVTVTVVGTEFVVERRGDATWVEVSRGKVRVSWGDGEAFLAAGESGTFPRGNATAADDGTAGREEVDPKLARGPHATQMYRSRVARRDYRGAYAVLSRNPALAGDTVEDLLVAADVARLSNHPSEAIPYLQRIVRERPRDERAPLAAFTLGRTLSGLGRTEEAMNMFARVHGSWPKSPLAEDALLREAEAASQLGDIASARRIAEQYDRDYPNGRRRAEVRRFARLE